MIVTPIRSIAVFTLSLFFAVPAFLGNAAERIAFVVGVDTYENLPAEAQLKVAVSDARLMAETLESLNPPFQVTLLIDKDLNAVEESYDKFLHQSKDAECALVYFAGHGVEYHGENFLLLKNTNIPDISPDVELMKRLLIREAVSLQGWVDLLERTQAQVKLVILDCCRNNPLKAEDGSGNRSVVGTRRGLAQVNPPSGTLISYSAGAGQQANDGLFTQVLTKNLKTPGMAIMKVFAQTREEVRTISKEWAKEDESKGILTSSRRVQHVPAEYSLLNPEALDFLFEQGGLPTTTEPSSDVEMAALRAQLAAERKAREEAEKKASMVGSIVPMSNSLSTAKVQSKPSNPPPTTKVQPKPFSSSRASGETGSIKVSEFTFSFAKPWVQQQVTSPMRAGQFLYDHEDEALADVELVLFFFGAGGAGGGGTQANIDRWIGQFEGTPETKTEEKEMGGRKVILLTAKGTYLESMGGPFSGNKTPKPDHTMLAAILPSDQGDVFLKLTGPTKSVEAMGDAFMKFTESPFAE